ncbi:MAG: dihydropteroate synthase, partial [Ignavibacteriaceae bacterium]|nr:dihydropteroate synthase [Ignavibacteriaceae bacterium]
MEENLISQVINLSNSKSFKLYKEKYNYSILSYHGLYGVELRNIPIELSSSEVNTNLQNIFYTKNSLLVTGSIKEFFDRTISFNLDKRIVNEIIEAIRNYEKCEIVNYNIGERKFDFKYAYIMGILNVTPDSFSDGGQFIHKENAVNYGIQMVENGVDIIDIGGESTRPGSEPVSESEELRRVIPVIEQILNIKPDALISIDTTKANVAKEALKSGALMVNDISGGKFDPDIFDVVAEFNVAMILMHTKGKPKTMQASPVYSDVVSEVYDYLATQSKIAFKHGIENIIIDPGIGFGKRTEDNLDLIERLEDFKSLEFPIMIGLSRKSFIGNILNLPIEDRDDATNAMNSFAISKGARIIRTHNVKQAVQTCKLYN